MDEIKEEVGYVAPMWAWDTIFEAVAQLAQSPTVELRNRVAIERAVSVVQSLDRATLRLDDIAHADHS